MDGPTRLGRAIYRSQWARYFRIVLSNGQTNAGEIRQANRFPSCSIYIIGAFVDYCNGPKARRAMRKARLTG